ncbi:hypothetical protein BJ546DRAFT_167539 [Cryomyces antarcticus]
MSGTMADTDEASPERGRSLKPKPQAGQLYPEMIKRPVSVSSNSSGFRQSRFIEVGEFDFGGQSQANNPYDTDSRVNLTHVTEGDHLDIPSQSQSRSVSPAPRKEMDTRQDHNTEIGTPSWLGVVQLVLQTLLLVLNCVAVGLLAKTLSKYHQTKGIHLSDGEPAWPSGINTRATNTMLVIGIGGLVATIALLFGSIWQRITDKALVQNSYTIGLGALLLTAWLASVVVFETERNGLQEYACANRRALSNRVVNYDLVCQEQTAAVDFGIASMVVEGLVLVSLVATAYLARRTTTTLPEFSSRSVPWRRRRGDRSQV